MKSAEEWAEYILEHVDEFLDSPVDSMVNPAKIYRAIQADAIKACAEECTKFLAGDPANGVPLRTPMPFEIARRLLSLLPKDTP